MVDKSNQEARADQPRVALQTLIPLDLLYMLCINNGVLIVREIEADFRVRLKSKTMTFSQI